MARPQTALNAHGMQKKVSDLNKTALIYGKIRDGQWADAVRHLQAELVDAPKSRAGLSLLGHCYYYMQEFGAAANTYEELVKHHPGIDEYKVYYAQSLYKAGMYDQALRVCHQVTDEQQARKVVLLQAACKYEQDDLVGCRSVIDESLPKSDPGWNAHCSWTLEPPTDCDNRRRCRCRSVLGVQGRTVRGGHFKADGREEPARVLARRVVQHRAVLL